MLCRNKGTTTTRKKSLRHATRDEMLLQHSRHTKGLATMAVMSQHENVAPSQAPSCGNYGNRSFHTSRGALGDASRADASCTVFLLGKARRPPGGATPSPPFEPVTYADRHMAAGSRGHWTEPKTRRGGRDWRDRRTPERGEGCEPRRRTELR